MRSFLLVASLVAIPAVAQTLPPQIDLNQLDVNSSAGNSLVVGTGELLAPGTFRASLALAYENNPQVTYVNGQLTGDVLSNRYTVHLVGGWAPFDWLEFGADVPIIAAQDGVDLERYGLPIPGRTGMGNPIATMRVGLFSQAKGAAFDVAGQLGVRLPLGSRGAWLSDQRVTLAPKLMLGRSFGWFRAGGELGLRWARDPLLRTFENPANVVMLAAVLTSGPSNGLRAEVSGRTTVSFTRQRGPIELLGGVRMPLGVFDVFALAGPNFEQGGAPSFRVLTGVTFGGGGGVTSPASSDGAGAVPAPTDGSAPPALTPVLPVGPEETRRSDRRRLKDKGPAPRKEPGLGHISGEAAD